MHNTSHCTCFNLVKNLVENAEEFHNVLLRSTVPQSAVFRVSIFGLISVQYIFFYFLLAALPCTLQNVATKCWKEPYLLTFRRNTLLSSAWAKYSLAIYVLNTETVNSSETSVTVSNRYWAISRGSPVTPNTLASTLVDGMYKCARQRPVFGRFPPPPCAWGPGKQTHKLGPKYLYMHDTLLGVIILLHRQKALSKNFGRRIDSADNKMSVRSDRYPDRAAVRGQGLTIRI